MADRQVALIRGINVGKAKRVALVESLGYERRSWIAAVLTLVLPGLGQLYGGRPGRAIATYFGGILLILAFLASGMLRRFGGLIALLLVSVLFLLWAIADAARLARRSQGYVLKPFNRWYVYLTVFLVSSFLVAPQLSALLAARSPVRAFRIPTESMGPAVLAGDHVFADLSYYVSSKPARGDIAVFSHPMAPGDLVIKRVIGLEGEQIEIRDKVVRIDGRRLHDPWAYHSDPRIFPPDSGAMAARDNLGPLKIPSESVFLIGDNRDASLDSRHFGPISQSSLQGRLLYIYWADDRSRIGRDLR